MNRPGQFNWRCTKADHDHYLGRSSSFQVESGSVGRNIQAYAVPTLEYVDLAPRPPGHEASHLRSPRPLRSQPEPGAVDLGESQLAEHAVMRYQS